MLGLEVILPAVVGVASFIGSKLIENAINRHYGKRNERESRRNADVERIENITFEIRDLACSYWSRAESEADQKQRAASIIGRLSFLSALVDELFLPASRYHARAQSLITAFDESCTSGDFGVASRPPMPERSPEIEVNAYAIVHGSASMRRRLK